MEITKDVVVDLLPVYYSGEASPATRAAVDDFLSRDAGFAERVRREWSDPFGQTAARPAPEAALRSHHRTKRMLSMQRWLFGVAMTLTAIPFSLEITFHGFRITEFHFLMRDYPGVLLPCLIGGLVCWGFYARLQRRLRVDLPA